jgi:hypothetical protein
MLHDIFHGPPKGSDSKAPGSRAAFKAIPEPLSLADLRKRAEAMLPRVDLP